MGSLVHTPLQEIDLVLELLQAMVKAQEMLLDRRRGLAPIGLGKGKRPVGGLGVGLR